MNKTELVNAVSEKTGLTKKDTEQTISAAFDVIADTLVEGGKIQLVGFGAFEVKERKARIGRNPKTLEQIDIAASRVAHFKPGKSLKDAVSGTDK